MIMKDSSKYRWIFRVKKKKSFVPLTLLKRALKLRGKKAAPCHREKCCLSEGRASFTRGFSVQGAGAALGKLHERGPSSCISLLCVATGASGGRAGARGRAQAVGTACGWAEQHPVPAAGGAASWLLN